MSGGRRYWNEETQRWEDPADAAPAAPVTPPPPGRPGYTPTPWPGAPSAATASGTGTATAGTEAGAGAGAERRPGTAPGYTAPDGGRGTPTDPATSGRPGRRLVWSLVAGVAVLGVAVGLVLTLVVADGEGEGEEEQDGPPTVAATPTPEPVQEPSESESPGVSAAPSATPPEGYEVFVDDEGFRIAVPQGWTRSEVESAYGMPVVNYRDADGSHRLQVFEVAEASPAASFELFLSEEEFQPKGFRKLALEELDQGDFAGSRLEYLADSLRGEPDLGTWHVYDLRFVAADGRVYALAAYGPDADGRDDELELVTYASAWFCPPGAECSAPLLR